MARLALVTGGQRGIGAAISEELKKAGRNVVASYAGNDAAAAAFTERTGIPTVKFDVSDYAACKEAVAKIAWAGQAMEASSTSICASVMRMAVGRVRRGSLHQL